MMRRLLSACLLGLFLMTSGWAEAIELKFQYTPNANIFWMIDQMSQWDEHYTAKAYRQYWEARIGLNDDDLAQLEKYARMRRRLAKLDGAEVQTKLSPWSSMFGRTGTLPHEQFALAFMEVSTVDDVALVMRLSPEDADTLKTTFLRFAKKMKDDYGRETAHLKGFCEKAQVLVSVADVAGFIGTLRAFLGITEALPQTIPVDVLWAPPGYVMPTHMQYHILLPVSVEQASSDETVLAHLSLAMREVSAYLFSKVSADTLSKASARLMSECGLVSVKRPNVAAEALLVAMGELLFLQERFPDLPRKPVLEPFDPALEVPHAVDTLAREFAAVLKPMLGQQGVFYPVYVDRMVEVVKKVFPPRPRSFAATAVVLADGVAASLFAGLFPGYDRTLLTAAQAADVATQAAAKPQRSIFLVVTPPSDGALWTALKGLGAPKEFSTEFKKLSSKPFIYPMTRKGASTVYIVRAPDDEGLRKALVWLYQASSLPTAVQVVE